MEEVARAFSDHRFDDTYPYLADDVVWNLVGEREVTGKASVIELCNQSASYLSEVSTEFRIFRALVGESWAVIDSLADCTDGQGEVSTVSSRDIYDFADGKVSKITSYTVAI